MRSIHLNNRGFTLIELLITIGIIGVLAGGVIIAVNPSDQFIAIEDSRRTSRVREFQNAINQYVIDTGTLPGDKTWATSSVTALDICRAGASDTSNCLVLDTYLVPKYIAELPVDPAETDTNIIGFTAYEKQGSFVKIDSTHLGVSAASACTSGGNPVVICDCSDLQAMNSDLTADYELGQDIDCDVSPYNTGTGFDPIGDCDNCWGASANDFTGTFDGKGYTIDNLYINLPADYGVGLFASMNTSGTVENVGITNAYIAGSAQVGILVGNLYDGTVQNVYVTGTVDGGRCDVSVYGGCGGITGTVDTGGLIQNSYSTADVEQTDPSGSYAAGGAVGHLMGEIRNTFAFGTMTIINTPVGHLVGDDNSGFSTITNGYWYDVPGDDATACHDNTQNTGCTEASAISDFYSSSYDVYDTTSPTWDFTTVWKTAGSALPTLRKQ